MPEELGLQRSSMHAQGAPLGAPPRTVHLGWGLVKSESASLGFTSTFSITTLCVSRYPSTAVSNTNGIIRPCTFRNSPPHGWKDAQRGHLSIHAAGSSGNLHVEEALGIDPDVLHVAAFFGELQLIGVVALDAFRTLEVDFRPLGRVVDQVAVQVCLLGFPLQFVR